jgi:hypothetical protein
VQAQQEIPREFAIPSVEGNVNSAYTKTPEFKRTVQGRVGDIADYLIQPIQVRVAPHAPHTPHNKWRILLILLSTLCSAFLGIFCC